jgi:hypothetical protein
MTIDSAPLLPREQLIEILDDGGDPRARNFLEFLDHDRQRMLSYIVHRVRQYDKKHNEIL